MLSLLLRLRKTVIKNDEFNVSDEDLIQKEDMVGTLTKTGFIKEFH